LDTSSLPSFSAVATNGQQVDSAALVGKPLILYFYPKDSTPGCTRESVEFAAMYSELQSLGVTIFGISRDSLKSHENFRSKQELPFGVRRDPRKEYVRAQGDGHTAQHLPLRQRRQAGP